MTEIKGWHVLVAFFGAFSIIISVNLTLAFNAVATFPGLVVKNSYVAGQGFDDRRAAQQALEWDVAAQLSGSKLILSMTSDGIPVRADIEEAVFAKPTHTSSDQHLDFTFTGQYYEAPVIADEGKWILILKARATNGTLFDRRIVVARQ